jgi:polar amino acid transport system substrate-binding protein
MTHKNRSKRALALLLAAGISGTAHGGATADRIRESGHVRFGYIAKAKPFTSAGANGVVEGYGAELCGRIAASLKSQLNLTRLAVDWVPVSIDSAQGAVSGGQVDVLCTPSNATLARRKAVSFSIPAFAGGLRAVVRNDITPQVREALENDPKTRPELRGTPAQGMAEATRFAAVAGTSSERWLAGKIKSYRLNTATVSVPDYASGIKFLLEDKIDVFLAEQDVALAAMDEKAMQNLRILNRQLTHEPLALALPRGDDDLRLIVDAALTAAYESADFESLYRKSFGPLDDVNRTFFDWVTPPP